MYDIADLYKAEVVIPLAFEVAAQAPQDLPSLFPAHAGVIPAGRSVR